MEDVHDLNGAHDEADIHFSFHAVHVEHMNPGNTVIKCNDTDILIIMYSNIQKFRQSVWLHTGLDYNNSLTFHQYQRNSWQTELHPSYMKFMPLLGVITLLHSSEKVKSIQWK